jgi:undecaprenyl-diphosphatase
MARFASAPMIAALARLDSIELRVCRRYNSIIYQAGLLRLFRSASRLGDGVLWYLLIAVSALFCGHEGRLVAAECVIAGTGGLFIYRTMKKTLIRERPFITHSTIVCAATPLDRFSFPSGHTLHAVSFTLIFVHAWPLAALVLVPVALLIAMSRVVLGLHYPSDVVAGAMLGAGIAEAVLQWVAA